MQQQQAYAKDLMIAKIINTKLDISLHVFIYIRLSRAKWACEWVAMIVAFAAVVNTKTAENGEACRDDWRDRRRVQEFACTSCLSLVLVRIYFCFVKKAISAHDQPYFYGVYGFARLCEQKKWTTGAEAIWSRSENTFMHSYPNIQPSCSIESVESLLFMSRSSILLSKEGKGRKNEKKSKRRCVPTWNEMEKAQLVKTGIAGTTPRKYAETHSFPGRERVQRGWTYDGAEWTRRNRLESRQHVASQANYPSYSIVSVRKQYFLFVYL